jgi:outer membrane cobalamin receptor
MCCSACRARAAASIPSSTIAAISATRRTAAAFGAGAAEIDLRYLGSRRVLVLVDGLRFVNGASASGVPGSTDLNAIPESAIERVEVLQDGASAIYGSDAIAGVVNIITKSRQRGFEASGRSASTKRATVRPRITSSAGATAPRVRCGSWLAVPM